VTSRTTRGFRKQLQRLPAEIREQARASYRLFAHNPHHPSLHFKQVHTTEPVYSARVGRNYRAVGFIASEHVIVWFWIGPHEQYETLLANQ
jgi:mRNA-degrading endonuclease RelE of RelBE toxin-antitoxin system